MSRLPRVFVLASVAGILFAGSGFSQQKALTLDDIVNALAQGVTEEVLRIQIEESGCDCRATGVRGAIALQSLRTSGASEEFIRWLLQQGQAQQRSMQPVAVGRTAPPSGSSDARPTTVTLFGGYSFGRTDADNEYFRNLHGWNANVSIAVNEWFSIAGDVAGHYKRVSLLDVLELRRASIHTFAVGPQFSGWGRTRRTRGFGHVMIGAANVSDVVFETFLQTDTRICFIIGGGLDVGVGKGVAIRAFQSDWVYVPLPNDLHVSVGRLSFGVVGRF